MLGLGITLIQPKTCTSPSAMKQSHLRPTCGFTPHSSCTLSTNACNCRSESLYEVLRVKHTATPTEIKTAYRRLAKVYHPDTIVRSPVIESTQEDGVIQHDGKSREFMEIHDAYATLSDPAARDAYDLTLGFCGRRQPRRGCGVLGRVGCRSIRTWETDQCW